MCVQNNIATNADSCQPKRKFNLKFFHAPQLNQMKPDSCSNENDMIKEEDDDDRDNNNTNVNSGEEGNEIDNDDLVQRALQLSLEPCKGESDTTPIAKPVIDTASSAAAQHCSSLLNTDELTCVLQSIMNSSEDWEKYLGVENNRKQRSDSIKHLIGLADLVSLNLRVTSGEHLFMTADILTELHSTLEILFGRPFQLNREELKNWCYSDISFINSTDFNIGLLQNYNGPCGVLAPLQCWVIFYILIRLCKNPPPITSPTLASSYSHSLHHSFVQSDTARKAAIAWAMTVCFYRCTPSSQYYLITFRKEPLFVTTTHIECAKEFLAYSDLCVNLYSSVSDLFTELLRLVSSKTPGLLLSFIISLIFTRTPRNIKADIDDINVPLVGLYGHSSQELVNLLLTGEAVTNIFDGDKNLGSCGDATGFQLKGIHRPQLIGYLTQLEALRYCEVGTFLKTPLFPLWVIGSSNHFTSLFTLDMRVSFVKESQQQLDTLSRKFDGFDRELVGMISAQRLTELLNNCGLSQHLTEARRILDPPGQGGVIIKYDFLEWATSKSQKPSSMSKEEELFVQPKRFIMYHYDGQALPAPALNKVLVEPVDFGGAIADDETADMGLGIIIRVHTCQAAFCTCMALLRAAVALWSLHSLIIKSIFADPEFASLTALPSSAAESGPPFVQYPLCDVAFESTLCFSEKGQSILPEARPYGIIGHYSFDTVKISDLSGHKNHAIGNVLAGPPLGGIGASALFRNNFFLIPHSASHETKDYSLTFWMYRLEDGESRLASTSTKPLERWCPILHKGLNEMDGKLEAQPSVLIDPFSGHVKVVVSTSELAAAQGEFFISNFKLNTHSWNHVAIIRHKKRLRLYINGILDSTMLTLGETLENAKPYYVGGTPWTEHICDLPIYNVAIGRDQIQGESAPAALGMEPSALFLSCPDCTRLQAEEGCPETFHLCTKFELTLGGYSVLRRMGLLPTGATTHIHIGGVTESQLHDKTITGIGLCCRDAT